MRRWSRLAAVCIAAGMALAVAGCGQLFQVKGSTSQPTLEELTQRVDQLEAQVSELNAAVAGMGQGRGQAATSSAASGSGAAGSAGIAANGAAKAIVTASYLNVHPQPDVTTPRVGVLKRDTVVSVLATEGNWTEVGFRTLKGWVESQWLEKPGSIQPIPPGSASSGQAGQPSGNGSNSASGGSSSNAAGGSSGNAGGGSSSSAAGGSSTNSASGPGGSTGTGG